jgi:GT2 family glycosyltransferase
MSRFSIITCVSRAEVYQKCLLDSINKTRGKHDIEIVPIINNDNRYSASNALNVGIDASKSDILIFVHQDVILLENWFDKLETVLSECDKNWGVIGCAGIDLKYGSGDVGKWGGALNTDTVAVGSVYDNIDKMSDGPYWSGIKETVPVHCIDECLFILNKKTGLMFDTMLTGFHFYGVDLCLQARSTGYTVYGADLPIVHYGKYSASFTGDKKYWVYLRYIYNKWFLRFPELFGTHMHWTPEGMTSYINIGLEDDTGIKVQIKSLGISKVRLSGEEGLFND